MTLSVRMSFAPKACGALAGTDRLGWHPSVLSPSSLSLMAALDAITELDRKPPKNRK